ncbi:MAG: archaellin/type IV pilin N-terminal domain-containing protein [Thermoplasmata archaeon]
MNGFGHRNNSWRKSKKRGVSPIIATILLVAITVVLAAVLYVLISGLTHGPGSAPLGSKLAWGKPKNTSGHSAIGCAAVAGHFCYSIEVASAGGGLSVSSVDLALQNGVGAAVSWPAGYTVSLVNPSGSTPASTYSITTKAWSNSAPFASGQTIVLYSASVVGSQGLYGDALVGIGGNGYSGTVSSTVFS